jgi:hypothetical protein
VPSATPLLGLHGGEINNEQAPALVLPSSCGAGQDYIQLIYHLYDAVKPETGFSCQTWVCDLLLIKGWRWRVW